MPFEPRLVKKPTGFNKGVGYWATNECIATHNKLLGDKQFSTVGGIASGGEVILCSLLPRATDRVYAVDISGGEILVCYFKILMLNEFGAEKTRDLLCSVSKETFAAETQKISAQLPVDKFPGLYNGTKDLFRRMNTYCRPVWRKLSIEALDYAAKNLHKIVLIHGEIRELVKEAGRPMDLLYSSNAVGYTSDFPTHVEAAPLVAEGGLHLTTSSSWKGRYNSVTKRIESLPEEHALWELMSEEIGKGGSIMWTHWLLRRKFAQIEEKAA